MRVVLLLRAIDMPIFLAYRRCHPCSDSMKRSQERRSMRIRSNVCRGETTCVSMIDRSSVRCRRTRVRARSPLKTQQWVINRPMEIDCQCNSSSSRLEKIDACFFRFVVESGFQGKERSKSLFCPSSFLRWTFDSAPSNEEGTIR